MNFKIFFYSAMMSISLISLSINAMQADVLEEEKLWFDCLSELNPAFAHNLLELIIIHPHLKPCLEFKQSDVIKFFCSSPMESVHIETERKEQELLWIDCLRAFDPKLADNFLHLIKIFPALEPWLLLKQCEAEKIVATIFESQSNK